MATASARNRRHDDEGSGRRPESWIAYLLLCCGITGLLLLLLGGASFIGAAILKISFGVVVAGLAAIAGLFLWPAARELWTLQFSHRELTTARIASEQLRPNASPRSPP